LAEVFNWAQDLDMNLILGIWDGHYLDGTSIAKADLQPYIDDSLDELEYILGSQSTTYGALRASHGHPDPWPLTYVEIGNEDNLSEGLE
jgi:alpha-N-arabinofuranosidase